MNATIPVTFAVSLIMARMVSVLTVTTDNLYWYLKNLMLKFRLKKCSIT